MTDAGSSVANWTSLAGLAATLGVSRTLVCKYRTGSRPPSGGFLAKLTRVVDNKQTSLAVGCDKKCTKKLASVTRSAP